MFRTLNFTALLRSLRRATPLQDKLFGFALASFVVTSFIPILSSSPTADVSGYYTDHIHHPFAVWVALTKGPLAVYRDAFADAWQGSTWPHQLREWPQMPGMAYPPGVLLFYLPITLLGKLVPMQTLTFARISMLWVLAAAHVSMLLVWRLVYDVSEKMAFFTCIIVWLLFLELGLEGFHDSLVFGLGAYAMWLWRRERLAAAFVSFSAAMSLHFRVGVVFAPVGLLLLWSFWKKPQRTRQDWQAVVFTALVGIVCAACLLVSLGRAARELDNLSPALETTRMRIFVSVLALGIVAAHAYLRDWLPALVTLAVLAMMITERCAFYWHGTIMLAVPLTVGLVSERAAKNAHVLRSIALIWILVMRPLVWRTPIDFVFQEIVHRFV